MTSLITGRIYKITSPNTEQCYIGSTIQSLHRRFQKHISDWKSKEKKRFFSSFFILENGDATIELLEEVQVESVRDLEMIEQNWIDKTPNTVNMFKAYISEEHRAEYWKEYKQEHKEKYIEYYHNYYEEHKEKRAKQSKKRWDIKKDEINEKRREKELCEICKCLISNGGKKQHERSKKHIRNFEMSS